MLNLQVIGNLGADAEVKDFNGRRAVVFNVAHTERFKGSDGVQHETTTWVSCIWNSEGGNLLQYLRKGTQIFCTGTPTLRVYDSPKEHCKVAGLNLRVSHIELVGGKREDTAPQNVQGGEGQQPQAPTESKEDAPF